MNFLTKAFLKLLLVISLLSSSLYADPTRDHLAEMDAIMRKAPDFLSFLKNDELFQQYIEIVENFRQESFRDSFYKPFRKELIDISKRRFKPRGQTLC